jgi:hypothetical protein
MMVDGEPDRRQLAIGEGRWYSSRSGALLRLSQSMWLVVPSVYFDTGMVMNWPVNRQGLEAVTFSTGPAHVEVHYG